jgi:hypothetical protein
MRPIAFACFAFLAVATSVARGQDFIVPDSTTGPFENWSRNAPNSMYAEWNNFKQADTNPNNPDVGSFGPATATVVQTVPGAAIIAGSPFTGGNIYALNAPTAFDVTIPNYNLGAGYNTRVVAQIRTNGEVILPSSVSLSYSDGVNTVTPGIGYYNIQNSGVGMTAVQLRTFAWDIAGFNPGSLLLEFAAAGQHMSLDRVVIDTFAQTDAFAALPASVPEPGSLGLAAVALLGLVACGRRANA